MKEITARDRGSHLLINLSTRQLSYVEGNKTIRTYPVGVGKSSTPTPTGSFSVIVKILNPGGALGTRWMGLSAPGGNYGIHGTNNPPSIGGYVSNGCIRMYNHDVEELFPRVSIGTPVEIVSGKTGINPPAKPVQQPGNPPAASSQAGSRKHTVQPGESLWQIARKYNLDLQEIIRANQLANPDVIYPGQTILIPG
ncbi:MAG: putative L,D-transpeptidase YkuD [Firmicutes bacterium ADurb.Bin456]|nr:MAG: putative L,D-transpeptidase YkuD [Firmicutes bacterium ADurb.Bin456]